MWLLMVFMLPEASQLLAATLGGGDVNAGGLGARTSAVDDGHSPGSEGRDNSASPSSYLLTVHDDAMMLNSPLSECRSWWQRRRRRL